MTNVSPQARAGSGQDWGWWLGQMVVAPEAGRREKEAQEAREKDSLPVRSEKNETGSDFQILVSPGEGEVGTAERWAQFRELGPESPECCLRRSSAGMSSKRSALCPELWGEASAGMQTRE